MAETIFAGWEDFYLLIGSAAAALIGLLFVVVTLTTRMGRCDAERGARLYMSPIVFHLAAIFVLSAVAMAPGLPQPATAVFAGAAAFVGLGVGCLVSTALGRAGAPAAHWSDLWFYGVAPAALYAML